MTTNVLNTRIGEVQNEIPDVSGLVTSTVLSGLVTATVLNTKIGEVQNNILGVNGLVKKTDNNAKISELETKYFTTYDYNKVTIEIFETKIKEQDYLISLVFIISLKILI